MTPPPPTDHVARALLSRGARDHALHLLRAAVARDPNERACAALLRAVEARPDASVSGPEVALDLGLVDAYVGRSMLVEAHAVLHGSGLDRTPEGAARAQWLNVVLAPAPSGAEPELVEILQNVYTGGASLTLTLLEERAAAGTPLPPWADEKREHLRHLVLGLAKERPDDDAEPARALPPLSRGLATRLGQRDWPGAQAEAEGYAQAAPDDASARALVDALRRIAAALQKRHADTGPSPLRTAPMTPQMTADLNLRMANLEEAERLYRKVVLEATADASMRQMLDDIQLVRKHLDPRTAPRPRSVMSQPTTSRPTPPIVAATRPTEPIHPPNLESLASMPTPLVPIDREEVTRRASEDELRRERDRSRGRGDDPTPAPEPPLPMRPTAPIAPTPSSVLSKKSGPISGGYAAGTLPSTPGGSSDWEKDQATDIVRPEQEAELFLSQGRVDKAIQLYELLAARKPKFAARLEEIRALASAGRVVPADEVTVRRDVRGLSHLTAASTESVPPHVPTDRPAHEGDEELPPPTARSGPVAKVFGPPGAQASAARAPAPQPSPAHVGTAPTLGDSPRAGGPPGSVRVTRIVRVG